ncbi:MAG: hypothetical protein IPN09_04970 [Bacteroidetes bacterium]|nr:hypothetical protein [Bacteroidota bacterium]
MKLKSMLMLLVFSSNYLVIQGQVKYFPPEDHLILSIQTTGFEDTSAILSECQSLTTLFMNDEISVFFEKLKEIWILPSDEIDYLEEKTIKQLNILNGRFGNTISNSLVKSEYLDSLLFRLTFVIKFEYHAIKLRYTFYNGLDNKWYFNNFKWDDEISQLLE